jgi:trimethyllysine dioxygenase
MSIVPRADSRRILWNSKIGQNPPTVAYDTLDTDAGVLRWLNRVVSPLRAQLKVARLWVLSSFGCTPYARGDPGAHRAYRHHQANALWVDRLYPLTTDGGFWDFTSDMSHGDLAYSSEGLPAHTDTTYFTDPAGLQIFHCLKHEGEGGQSLLVDGFYSASILASLHPTSYSLLSRLKLAAHASGTPGTILRPLMKQPVLRHDEKGELVQVRWNNEDRGIITGWTPDEVKGWYQAARQFESLSKDADAEYWLKLTPGTMVGESVSGGTVAR